MAAGLPHLVRPTSVPEIQRPGESPRDFVARLAEDKASAVTSINPGDVVLGADTVVSVENHVLGKPANEEDAVRMLRLLSGRDHLVYTGICLLSPDRKVVDVAVTKVYFLPMTETEVQEYTRSGESRDKAGAYAIQGLASKFVSAVEGCYQNVVGLPVSLVYRHLKSL